MTSIGTDITTKNINGKTVIIPSAPLTVKNSVDLKTVFNDLMKRAITDIILDMGQVAFLDSAALELLISMQGRLKQADNELILLDINAVCRDILICTRMINGFKLISRHGTQALEP
ncbi:MAG: STAS domain-containing protein [Desulfobacterium sp.]|nr:STAS domain-containing protein [Desulfobacterium sp.]